MIDITKQRNWILLMAIFAINAQKTSLLLYDQLNLEAQELKGKNGDTRFSGIGIKFMIILL